MVGSYEKVAPHPWGLCDMHGNVYQWCANMSKSENNLRSARGGSWRSSGNACSSAERHGYEAEDRNDFLGFRVGFRPD